MEKIKIIIFISLLFLLFSTCGDKDDIDTEVPEIDLSQADAYPLNCDTLYFGETYTFKFLFKDNVELGSSQAYSIDIHNNFDHHSHSTEVTECTLDEIKDAENAYVYLNSFDLPEGESEYEEELEFTIPSEDSDGNAYDTGDYHFFISLTDKEGWSAQKGLSIKILYP